MSKAKWFVVRKPSTGEIITSASHIVPPKFHGPTKMLYYIHETPFPLAMLKWGLGTRLGRYKIQKGVTYLKFSSRKVLCFVYN